MAVVSARIEATPDDVFATLADGWLYGNWIVGTSHIRAVENGWPAAGTKLFHASGSWPLVTRDEAVVDVSEPPRLLVVTARGRPFGQARVTIELAADRTGTIVTMSETPITGPGSWLNNPLTELLLKRRNIEALARLTASVERPMLPREDS